MYTKQKTSISPDLSIIFKERITNMPDDINNKEIIAYAKNIIKDIQKEKNIIEKGKKVNLKKNVTEKTKNNLSYINSQTAKNGYKEEELICKDLNNEHIRKELIPILGNDYDECECNSIKGKKSDILSKNKIIKGQVKKYKKGRFQQFDRHWINNIVKYIPELKDASQILKDLFEYPLLPNGTHVDKSKPIKKLCTSNYSQEVIENFLDILNNNITKILEYAFLGTDLEFMPEYLFGVEYVNEKRNKIIVFKITNIIKYLEKLKFKVSKNKTCILLGEQGTISLQRKGGDKGKKGSNQLQFKIILSNLIDKVSNIYFNL
jgi:hypothetical protein